MSETASADKGFDDLLAANREYAEHFDMAGFDGIARAGVAIVTCMDSRIAPLQMVGLKPGDAKIFRNPGGRIGTDALEALILATHLLGVDRVVIIPHTRCAMALNTEPELQELVASKSGHNAAWQEFHTIDDQQAALREDVEKVRTHPLIASGTRVGGFMYDVDTGLLHPASQ
ncbi:carbonic anhydrase [Terrabacter sp. Root181]|uniref:beta-class carbonic anhydrase n=1 Tax=Terrabacter sp. Root181 TaxID=1736484 RepID=UPI0006FBA0E9|nr:carbonic anhydrase [Terrabacter sp. Root181]KRB47885.1 carbonic anhydrase [Terrabacter sp. Root181]